MPSTIPLATTRWGSGPHRALLLHGIMSNAAGWWRLAPDLVGHGFEVVAPDLRGHGASPRGDEMTLAAYRDDVLELGATWDLVLGHSLGGAIAVEAIAVRPDWTGALILEDPALILEDVDAAIESLTEPWEAPINRESVATANPTWHPHDIDLKVDMLHQCGRETVVRTVTDSLPYDVRPHLDAIEVPTLILGADPIHGALTSPELGTAIAGAHPNIDFDVVPDGSHSMHRDAYAGFWARIDRFLVDHVV